MARHFRIHPAIGVARVGNAPDAHFIGPEHSGRPANWGVDTFESFRDESGRIKRQAARFRVFEYIEDDQGRLGSPKEVTVGGDVTDIEWRVHVANRKASFFTFNGQSGARDINANGLHEVYAERSTKAATAQEKDDPVRANRRNADVPAADRRRLLEIDPGEKVISKANSGPVILTSANSNIPFIPDLGELRLDDAGRLLVLGGHGTSGSTEDPPRSIDEYANNDRWFDDVCDGSVKARVRLTDGTFVDADAAWVLVGPPDFAPGIGNVVSFYETVWDVAVRKLALPKNTVFVDGALKNLAEQKSAWFASGEQSLAGYKPSFTREIYPLLARAFAARHVFDPGEMDRGSFHLQLIDWNMLAQADSGTDRDEGRIARREIFKRMRNPASNEVDWLNMPRGLGDDYDALEKDHPIATSFLSLTRIQYALLEQWANSDFESDWPGDALGIPDAGEVSPAGLDQAALENCVGGPFYPGIEVSWLVREPQLYVEPFRLNVSAIPESELANAAPGKIGALDFGAGFFTQQMALPWQADFYDCHKERFEAPDSKPYFYMWWTAQRPDDVYPVGASEQVPWVRRFIPAGQEQGDFEEAVKRFKQMQENWWQLRFVVGNKDRFEEETSS